MWRPGGSLLLSLGTVTLQALALALPFKASKWQGQGLKCQGQGQGLTSLLWSHLKNETVEEGHVPQCPIAGDAHANACTRPESQWFRFTPLFNTHLFETTSKNNYFALTCNKSATDCNQTRLFKRLWHNDGWCCNSLTWWVTLSTSHMTSRWHRWRHMSACVSPEWWLLQSGRRPRVSLSEFLSSAPGGAKGRATEGVVGSISPKWDFGGFLSTLQWDDAVGSTEKGHRRVVTDCLRTDGG